MAAGLLCDESRVVMREKSSQSIWSEEQHRLESLRKDGVDDTLRFSPSDKLTFEYLSSTLPCVEGTRLLYMLNISPCRIIPLGLHV